MALIDTIPLTDATKPAALSKVSNGQLPADWLRAPDGSTRDDFKAFVPVSYAIQAMHLAAADDGITLRTTGRYRPLARQQALFAERYKSGSANNVGCGSKVYQGKTWYLQRSVKGGCLAMAAAPGTSNHGWGIADDFSEWDEGDPSFGSSLDQVDLQWLADNARDFFFALDVRSEAWHWHWYNPANPNTLSQRTVDVLTANGIKVPSLAAWGFTVPGGGPTPPPPTPLPPTPITEVPEGMWIMFKSTDGGHYAAPGVRAGAYHVSSQVPLDYPFADGDGSVFALLDRSNGSYTGKIVTRDEWSGVAAGLTKAEGFGVTGAQVA